MINFLKKQPALAKAHRLKDGAAKGFTIIEVLMVMAILSIAFGTIYKSFAQLNRSYTTENVKAGVQQGARIAVEFMVQDIRLVGLDPLGTANSGVAAGVPLPTSNWVEFTSDNNYDGEIVDTDAFEKIKYELVGNQLRQTNHLGQETMLDNVTNLSFTFLDADDQTTTTNSEIRSVVVSLTMERPAGRAGPVSRTYTTTVRCRNL
jgi:prepilin-type N-terminal cleavage/methylation domain-containing protein